MNAYADLALHDVTAIAAGAYLVSHDCPWRGALCFLLVATTSITHSKS